MLVIYLPVLQTAFHTVPLAAFDWAVAIGVASLLLFGMEAVKLVMRMMKGGARCPPGVAVARVRAKAPPCTPILLPRIPRHARREAAGTAGQNRPVPCEQIRTLVTAVRPAESRCAGIHNLEAGRRNMSVRLYQALTLLGESANSGHMPGSSWPPF